MDHTHQLPAHLGQWPCRIAPPAEQDKVLTLVEYTTDEGSHRIYLDEHELTTKWADEDRSHPITPLIPADAWLDNAPDLPFELLNVGSSGTSHNLLVDARSEESGRGWGPHPIRVLLGSNLAGLEADQAEQFACALLAAVREVRAKDADRWIAGKSPVTVGNLTDSPNLPGIPRGGLKYMPLCDGCPNQVLCIADQTCRIANPAGAKSQCGTCVSPIMCSHDGCMHAKGQR